jgi:hypothetical protein
MHLRYRSEWAYTFSKKVSGLVTFLEVYFIVNERLRYWRKILTLF